MRARLTPACHSAAHPAANSDRTRDFTNRARAGRCGGPALARETGPVPALPLLLTRGCGVLRSQ